LGEFCTESRRRERGGRGGRGGDSLFWFDVTGERRSNCGECGECGECDECGECGECGGSWAGCGDKRLNCGDRAEVVVGRNPIGGE
jgi:hypothetical protein